VIAAHAHHARPHHHYPRVAHATAYSPCSSGSTTAMGTHTHFGQVAQNGLRLGTWIETKRRVHGRRRFRVEDRIGAFSDLDFFLPRCADATAFGRRTVLYRVLPHGLRSR
jgi:3D (Asp-Asp-Asp) domain-containing protein